MSTTTTRNAEHRANTIEAEILIATQERQHAKHLKLYRDEENKEPGDIMAEVIRQNAYATGSIIFDATRWTRPITNTVAELCPILAAILASQGKTAMSLEMTSRRNMVHGAHEIARDLLYNHSAPLFISACLDGCNRTLYWQCVAIIKQFREPGTYTID